ncbi:hypothetical protein ACWFRT_21535 [Streptomyces anulatus]
MSHSQVTIKLTSDEALVLSHWLEKLQMTDLSRVVDDPAVWASIHQIAGTLDKALPELIAGLAVSLPRGVSGLISGAPLLPTRWDVEVEGTTVVFPGEDVRVGLSEDLAHFVAVAEEQMSGTLQVPWTATATNMDGTAQGTMFLPVAPVQSLFDLIEAANSIARGSEENDSESQE